MHADGCGWKIGQMRNGFLVIDGGERGESRTGAHGHVTTQKRKDHSFLQWLDGAAQT